MDLAGNDLRLEGVRYVHGLMMENTYITELVGNSPAPNDWSKQGKCTEMDLKRNIVDIFLNWPNLLPTAKLQMIGYALLSVNFNTLIFKFF